MEPGESVGESLPGQGGDVVVARLVEELLDLLLANGQTAQPGLDPLHRQCEQHEQHGEEYDSKSLHTGK